MNKNNFVLVFILCFLSLYTEGVAQVAINTDGSNPSTNTILDLNPAVGKALVPPKMNWAQIKAITPATTGMVVYDTEFNCLRIYNGTKWVCSNDQADLFAPSGSFTTQTASGVIVSRAVATDASGNVYITGNFSGTATFGILPSITSSGGNDLFIAKYSSTGTVQWVQKAGGTSDDYGYSIVVDNSSNVYITGYFIGAATFGALPPLTSLGNEDIFIAKYNSSGTAQWVKRAGGTNSEYARGIAINSIGEIFVTGSFMGTVSFGNLPAVASAGLEDVFIAKYDNNGNALWMQKVGSTSNDGGNSMTIDASGNVFITGYFSNTVAFGLLPSITAVGQQDIFIAKYDNNGNAQWVQKGGSTGFDVGNSVTTDASGNVFISGYFTNTATFGTLPSITSVGLYDVFIAKYDNNGIIKWVQKGGGTAYDEAYSIVVDALGNTYITGYFANTITFSSLPPITAVGQLDIFIAKYDSNGNAQWLQKAGGALIDISLGMTIDISGNIYITGEYNPNAQFGKQVLTSGSMFLMKYSE
jgi:hypothetical protein